MPQTILLTGASGLVGVKLKQILIEQNFNINVLTTQKSELSQKIYNWQPHKGIIDERAFQNVDTIIHLAGAGIADKRWSDKQKIIILNSRVQSANLIFSTLKKINHSIQTFISASAIGYYGNSGNVWVDENTPNDKGFLGNTCKLWEASANQFKSLHMRVAILRTGIVLAKNDGALPVMAVPVKLFIASPLGTGKQFMSWIHLYDLCKLYAFVVVNKNMSGTYNAVAATPVNNKEFIQTLAHHLHRPFWNLPLAEFMLKIILGQKAELVINGQRVSNEKIKTAGFNFKFDNLNEALQNIYS